MSSPLSKLDSLAGLVRNDGADTKPALLRVLTDFYIQKQVHSPEEDRHFTELALRLIAEVDHATRRDIARRLADHRGVPHAVLLRLNAELVGSNARDTNASPPSAAEQSPAPAQPSRPEVSPEVRAAAAGFSEQFFAADAPRRRALLRELDSGAAVAPLGIPDENARRACQNLEAAALRSRPYEFVREMERALSVSRPYAQAIVNDLSGEPMLVVAKALSMPVDVVQRILLLVNPAVGNSVRRVFELSELYQEMSPRAALRLISLWRNSEETASPNAEALRAADAMRRPLADPTRRDTFDFRPDVPKRDQRAS